MMGLDKVPLWQLLLISAILIVEWWLPRQDRIRANSLIELVTNLIVALGLTAIAICLLWRRKND